MSGSVVSAKELAEAGSKMFRQNVSGGKELDESQKKLLESMKQDNKGGLETPNLNIEQLQPLPFTSGASR